MHITKNKFSFGILLFLLIVNLLVIFDLNYFYLRAIFSFVFLTTIPGLLIMLMLKIRKINPWEYLVYVVGLSIAFLIFAGLLINWILPLFGVDKPLSLYPILISFNIYLLIFWLIAYRRNKKISLEIKPPKLDRLNEIFFTIPMIFPVLSVLGVIILNNHGPNYLTMIMLGGIAVYVFLVVLFRDKLNKNVYPWAILMISISLLLMFSLRSWHISGTDISEEYQMFQLTKEVFHWSMSNFRHAYNACLSVTILPTIFDSFLKINDEYIFKLLFQVIFAFVPVGIFLFSKKYMQTIPAFIAGFFSMSFLSFLFYMSMHARQEIALLFFTLTLLVLFNKNINPALKKILFLIFGFLMAVSHYTTTYVALALFVFTYLICLVFRKTGGKKPFSKIYEKFNLKERGRKSGDRIYYLSGILILLLVVFTFLWYAQLTETSGNFVDFTHKTIENLGKIFTEEVRQEGIVDLQWNIFYKPNPTPLLQNYTKEATLEYKNKPYIDLYSPREYEDYKPRVTYSKMMPPKTNPNVLSKIYLFIEIIRKLLRLFIVVGVFYLLFFQLKKRKIGAECIIMTLGCLFLMGIIIFVPYVSIEYNFGRAYQQILVILSFPAVLGGLIVFKFLKKNVRIFLVSAIFLTYFLPYSGFTQQTLGGTEAPPQLNNFGTEYNRFYTHDSEVKSAKWLSNNYNERSSIYTDWRGRSKLYAFGKTLHFIFAPGQIVLPSIIDKNAYVYLTYSNKIKNIGFIWTKSISITYNFPTKFLNQNKNLIYNNGESAIFK